MLGGLFRNLESSQVIRWVILLYFLHWAGDAVTYRRVTDVLFAVSFSGTIIVSQLRGLWDEGYIWIVVFLEAAEPS